MRKYLYYLIVVFPFLFSCTNKSVIKTENLRSGKLENTYELIISDTKRYKLDSVTAPKPLYMQLISDSANRTTLTFLNEFNNSIYMYDYLDTLYLRSIKYDQKSDNTIRRASGYYIRNMDSIYVYDMSGVAVSLINSAGALKEKIILHDNDRNWPYRYPQYALSTVNPIFEYDGRLILTGQYFPSIPAEMIDKFYFTSYININNNHVEYRNTYPKELYGSDANWEGGVLTTVYPELLPDGTIIHSYPVSHDIYKIHPDLETVEKVYAGSNTANAISSINYKNVKETPKEMTITHYLYENSYTAIKYDKFRKIYYRYLLGSVPDATFNTSKEEKPITIIIMDDKFNYLGETNIGTGWQWNWSNSFVTEEGLNIEYIADDSNEDYLILKIFSLKKI